MPFYCARIRQKEEVEAGVTATPSAAEQVLWGAVTASLGTVGGRNSLEKEVYLT